MSIKNEVIQRVGIVGAGAMGSFYAAAFSRRDRDGVFLVAAGERYDRLRRDGIVVNGVPYHIETERPEDTSPTIADLMIVAVKNHHLDQAIDDMRPFIGSATLILSVMNGIDSEERIGAVYGMERMLYGVAVGIDAVRMDNRTNYSGQGTLFFGRGHNVPLSDAVMEVQQAFEAAGIVYETPADMIRTLWWKFMINVGINQSSAVLRAPYGVFQQSAEARHLMDAAMREVVAVAAAAGIDITGDDVDQWYEFMGRLSPSGKTSMLQDVEACRKTEVELFSGTIVALGEKYGIPTPVNRTLYSILTVTENEYLRERNV